MRISSLGDRMLARLVPRADRPVQAADCWYEYQCLAPVLRQRQCCYYGSAGGVRCGPWHQIGYC